MNSIIFVILVLFSQLVSAQGLAGALTDIKGMLPVETLSPNTNLELNGIQKSIKFSSLISIVEDLCETKFYLENKEVTNIKFEQLSEGVLTCFIESLKVISASSVMKDILSPIYIKYLQVPMRSYYLHSNYYEEYPDDYKRTLKNYFLGESISEIRLKKLRRIDGFVYSTNDWYLGDSSIIKFWFRRTVDGSADQLRKLLKVVIKEFDPVFHQVLDAYEKSEVVEIQKKYGCEASYDNYNYTEMGCYVDYFFRQNLHDEPLFPCVRSDSFCALYSKYSRGEEIRILLAEYLRFLEEVVTYKDIELYKDSLYLIGKGYGWNIYFSHQFIKIGNLLNNVVLFHIGEFESISSNSLNLAIRERVLNFNLAKQLIFSKSKNFTLDEDNYSHFTVDDVELITSYGSLGKYYSKTFKINLYKFNKLDSEVIGQLTENTLLLIKERLGGWAKVQFVKQAKGGFSEGWLQVKDIARKPKVKPVKTGKKSPNNRGLGISEFGKSVRLVQ